MTSKINDEDKPGTEEDALEPTAQDAQDNGGEQPANRVPAEPEEPVTDPAAADPTADDPEPETFPRAYVEQLRKEAAGYRERAKRADDLAQRLHTALVDATGRMADARDLPFDEAHLDDPQALLAAVEALLADRPHLASRTPMGNIGQGVTPVSNDVSLGGILRAGAM